VATRASETPIAFDTKGTVLERAGVPVERVPKVSESPENVAELIRGGKVDLVINTPFGRGPRTDGYFIRTAAATAAVPCITTLPGLFAALRGIGSLKHGPTEPRSLQEHHEHAKAAAAHQERLALGGSVAAQSEGRASERTRQAGFGTAAQVGAGNDGMAPGHAERPSAVPQAERTPEPTQVTKEDLR